jgi:4-amino-4-deoxy-L-arabinose transferase-like glycosyltransferase
VAALGLDIVLLCFATALCTYALISKPKSDWDSGKLFSDKRIYTILVISALIIAVLVRVWKFGSVPYGANQDEAMAAVDAHALTDWGTDRFGMSLPVYFTAWGYGQMSVLLSYCMVPFIKVFGFSVVTARLPMLLASLAGVWVLYRFAGRVFGRGPALLVLAFAAINPWQIMQSRWALDCNMLPHFLLFSVYFLHRGLDKKFYLYLSMVFFALTMYAYGIAFYTVPLLLLALCIYLVVTNRVRLWEAGVCALVYFFVAWPIFAVVFINYFKLQTLRVGPLTMAFFPDSIRINDLLIFSKDFYGQLLANIRSFFGVALLEKGDFSWNYIPDYGRMYLFTLPFMLLGLLRLIRRGKGGQSVSVPQSGEGMETEAPFDTAGRFILMTWLAVAVFSGLMVNNVNTNRMNIIFYPLCMLAGLGIWHALFEALRKKVLAGIVAAVYIASFCCFTVTYFGSHAKALEVDFCGGLTDAVKYADGLGSDIVWVTSYSRDPTAYTCSEIYTLLGAGIDARYFQGRADAYGEDGRKRLPYRERYRYVSYYSFNLNQPVGSVFVINTRDAGERSLFDNGAYELTEFGNFGVAVKVEETPAEPEGWDQPDEGWDDEPVG